MDFFSLGVHIELDLFHAGHCIFSRWELVLRRIRIRGTIAGGQAQEVQGIAWAGGREEEGTVIRMMDRSDRKTVIGLGSIGVNQKTLGIIDPNSLVLINLVLSTTIQFSRTVKCPNIFRFIVGSIGLNLLSLSFPLDHRCASWCPHLTVAVLWCPFFSSALFCWPLEPFHLKVRHGNLYLF